MKKELKKILEREKGLYLSHAKTWKQRMLMRFTHDEAYELYRWSVSLRKTEYYAANSKSIFGKLLCLIHSRKANIRGNRLGFFISPGCLGEGVKIFHKGSIIINHRSVVGAGCKLHGDNCIGNNGLDLQCPVLGKNVDVGIGAKIIGGITIADDIIIGANAVVTKSFLEPGITIAGVPARRIK